MQHLKIKDIRHRVFFAKREKLQKFHKFLFVNLLSRLALKDLKNTRKTFTRFYKRNVLSLKTRVSSRCVLTNKARSINRRYNISRSKLRELMQFGVLSGYTKAVW